MKKLFTLSMVIFIAISAFAQAPEKMSYQVVIRNNGDELVVSHAIGMRISILQGSAIGTPVYVETQTPTTNANGLVSIEIGGGVPITGLFSSITWANGTYYLKTETDPTGGSGYTITGTSQLLSVPYALYAKTAGSHYIGESYGGGIVFYVYDNGQHGLIAATADLSPGSPWTTTTFSKTGCRVHSGGVKGGLSNTMQIIIQAGGVGGYAAHICANYSGGGFGDWYLPCFEELRLLYYQKAVIGGFVSDYYWSSTEESTSLAVSMDINNGALHSLNKEATFRVRAIRAF